MPDQNELINRIELLENNFKNEVVMREVLRDYCLDRLGSALNSSFPLNIYERINKLESHIEEIKERINILFENNGDAYFELKARIEKLEFNQLGQQLDPKVWKFLTERIDKIEEMTLNGLSIEAYVKLNERLTELEEWTRKDEDKIYERLKEADGRIDKLEDHVKNMTESYLKKIIKNAKPHKCPVCDGNRVRIYLNTDVENDNYKSQVQENKCHACEGNGIVWG